MVDLLMVLYVEIVGFGDLISLMSSGMCASSSSLFISLVALITDVLPYYRVRRCGISSCDGPIL